MRQGREATWREPATWNIPCGPRLDRAMGSDGSAANARNAKEFVDKVDQFHDGSWKWDGIGLTELSLFSLPPKPSKSSRVPNQNDVKADRQTRT